MTRKKKLLVGLVAILLAIQLVPVERENPPVTGVIDAPAEVVAILERACYDCHSNKTVWPWYSHVAPVSFLVADDVEEAREHLNFSEWDRLSAAERSEAIEEIWEEVEEDEMPLWFYTPLHPEAKLSDADRETLHAWAALKGGDKKHARAE
jgi:cytochrome c551/c552